MAQDRNGNNHKAAGRPDGGQFDRKAGQGSDDDLDFGGYVAGVDGMADREAMREHPETLTDDDWRTLRHSDSWGVRMTAWSSPHSPKPTDEEFGELLDDESPRVRGAAAYRGDLTERQVDALLHDSSPIVRRKALMSFSASKESIENSARFDNNRFVRETAEFRMDPAGESEPADRTRDAIYGEVHVADGTSAPAGIVLPAGRHWRRVGDKGARIDLSRNAVADMALVQPSGGMSNYAFRKKYGISRPGALDPTESALLIHTHHGKRGVGAEIVAILPLDAEPTAEALDDLAFAFDTEAEGYLKQYYGSARAALSITPDGVDVDIRSRSGHDEEASAKLRDRMVAERGDAIDALFPRRDA